jgi:hypothetical protein
MKILLGILFLILGIPSSIFAILMFTEIFKRGGLGGGDGSVGVVELTLGIPAGILAVLFIYLAFHFFTK